jgi:hypothetical protein
MCFRSESALHEREQFAFTLKTVLASRNRHKNEIILAPTVINENEFLLAKKYLSMKGVCSVENRILDSVDMSLPST